MAGAGCQQLDEVLRQTEVRLSEAHRVGGQLEAGGVRHNEAADVGHADIAELQDRLIQVLPRARVVVRPSLLRPPELDGLHGLIPGLHDQLLAGGLQSDVHHEDDVSAAGDQSLGLPPECGNTGGDQADAGLGVEDLLVESVCKPVHLFLRPHEEGAGSPTETRGVRLRVTFD